MSIEVRIALSVVMYLATICALIWSWRNLWPVMQPDFQQVDPTNSTKFAIFFTTVMFGTLVAVVVSGLFRILDGTLITAYNDFSYSDNRLTDYVGFAVSTVVMFFFLKPHLIRTAAYQDRLRKRRKKD